MTQTLTITQPDDWHIHLRDGDALTRTVSDASKQFARAIVMPNLQPAISQVGAAEAYYQRILAALPATQNFQPLMTLYLTAHTSEADIRAAAESDIVYACKLYPAGVTTHSDSGVHQLDALYPIFALMQEVDLPLLIHGEVPQSNVDIFDRERLFIDEELTKLIKHFPKLRVVLEHISTAHAAEFIMQAPAQVAATITAHHLLLNRNDLLSGGIKPHHYCLPILKRSTDQTALLRAATSANRKFFLGTDSAPHSQTQKQSPCGCAGVYTAHAAIELYALAFEQVDALDKLEGFASHFGADFYQLPRNQQQITLSKSAQSIPDYLDFANEKLIPLFAGQPLAWSLL